MNGFEFALTITSGVTAIFGLFYVAHLVKVSGRDRPRDPESVRRLVRNAPFERLALVLNDYDVGTNSP
jgi:hypothetical protein